MLFTSFSIPVYALILLRINWYPDAAIILSLEEFIILYLHTPFWLALNWLLLLIEMGGHSGHEEKPFCP
jgi:hypothetical protein